jgi:hypothetical protein
MMKGTIDMNKKLISWLSNGMLIVGAGTGIYALAEIYLMKSNLPAGVCPVTAHKSLLYVSIILCVLSFVFSFFDSRPVNKKTIKGQDNNIQNAGKGWE